MSWSNGYLGIPWRRDDHGRHGTHCWGLVRLVYAAECGLDAGDYGPAPVDRTDTAARMERDLHKYPWFEIDFNAPQKPFDIVLIGRAGIDDHVGILVSPTMMLHLPAGSQARIEALDDARWRRRITGIYRHRALA